jgi:molybdopterin-guanine dinucleotide biosynthesis protein A
MNIGDTITCDILILAGGDAPQWYEGEPKVPNKCLVPILGKPMITYILETLKTFSKPHKTILLGTQSLLDAKVDKLADQFVLTPVTNKLSDNIRAGIKNCTADYVIILTGDTPALSTGALDDLYQSIETFPKKDLLVFVVTKPDVDILFPGSKRTYAKIKEGLAKVGNAMVLQRNAMQKLDPLIDSFTTNRKSVFRLALSFGIGNIIKLFLFKSLSLPELEKALLKSTGLDAKAILFPHGEIAVDLDKASDFADLETYLRRQL